MTVTGFLNLLASAYVLFHANFLALAFLAMQRLLAFFPLLFIFQLQSLMGLSPGRPKGRRWLRRLRWGGTQSCISVVRGPVRTCSTNMGNGTPAIQVRIVTLVAPLTEQPRWRTLEAVTATSRTLDPAPTLVASA